MPIIRVKDTEPFDVTLRRFKRSCEKAGIISDIRKHEFYEKPTAKRKREKSAAIKRQIKKLKREKQSKRKYY